MKIEKINDNQIKCTLTKADLADRQIKLSELAYGSDKAKSLFKDMLLQAFSEFGFEANDIPLMIEAIPMPNECIVLIITKVSDPEELDTRFSKFSPSVGESMLDSLREQKKSLIQEGADEILDLFRRLTEQHLADMEAYENKTFGKKSSENGIRQETVSPEKLSGTTALGKTAPKEIKNNHTSAPGIDLARVFIFSSLDNVIEAAHTLNGLYQGENRLYKNPEKQLYYLVLHKSSHTPEDFNRFCNILSEYAGSEPYSRAAEAYMAEHYETAIKTGALQKLLNA